MKITSLFLLFATISLSSHAQLDATTYDFWQGKWNATWKNQDGTVNHGTNHIEYIMDGKVLQEHFEIADGKQAGFKGTSISVFNPNTKQWHQAWADNQGGYFDFIGAKEGDKMIFNTKPVERDGKSIVLRMVFYDIKEDSFTWDWQGSQDGGATWNLLWRINYSRAN